MLNPALPPECYTSENWFNLEKESIFKKLWIFVGLEEQFQDDNDFISREIAGIPILVQKIDGELFAFRNACAHRGQPIQIKPYGNRKLICPYHGWSFRKNGILRGIPNEKIYNICDSEKSNISLIKYKVEKIGSFIFINLNEHPIPIEDQFPEDIKIALRVFSNHFSPVISYTKFYGNYNWKLNFENVLDWNHVQFVHPQTFAPALTVEKNGFIASAKNQSNESHSDVTKILNSINASKDINLENSINLKDISKLGRCRLEYQHRWFSEILKESVDPGAITVCSMFPNLNFGSIHGESFYIQQYIPISPEKTEYHSWILTSKIKENLPAQPHLLWGIHHAEKRVVDEDIEIFNSLQKALNTASTVGHLGQHEKLLAALGLWYMENIKE